MMERTEFIDYVAEHWPALHNMGWKDPRGWVNSMVKNPDDFMLAKIGVDHIEMLAAQDTTIERKDRDTVADEVTPWFAIIKRILELHALGQTPDEIQAHLPAPDGGVISMDTIWKQIKNERTRVDHFIKHGMKDLRGNRNE